MTPVLVMLMSRNASNFERSNISLKENNRDGVDLNSSSLGYCVRKNLGKIACFSTDCIKNPMSSPFECDFVTSLYYQIVQSEIRFP